VKRLLIPLIIVAFVLTAGSAFAATATNTLNASVNVVNGCRVLSVTDINFGSYDVTDPTDLDAAGDFTFRCTKGTAYEIYITGARTMTDGTDTLNFELYTDPARTSAWQSAASGSTVTAASNAPATMDVYGRIPAQQNVGVGAYTGSVTITVLY
jgi:spore coat protein U-like protein